MTAKQIIALVVGIVALGVTVWKGPGAWAAVSGVITALCLFALPILAKNPQFSEYVADLEAELDAQKPGKVAELRRARRLPPRADVPIDGKSS